MIKKYFVMFIIIFSPSFMYADSEFSKRSENITREETSGFLGGAILGGAAGGPPGILLGAGIGALLGDNWQKIKGRTKTLELALKESNLTLAVTQNELVSLRERYELAKLETDRYKVSTAKEFVSSNEDPRCCDAAISIHFQTGKSQIENHYKEQLESIGILARRLGDPEVAIYGYADRNGDTSRNLELSRQRTDSVKAFLTKNGLNDATVTTVAYGETRPVQTVSSLETDFFDRRVTVHIRANKKPIIHQIVSD